MKIQKYIRNRGIEAILIDCNYNLRLVKNHLRNFCDLPKDKELTAVIKLFKEYLEEKTSNDKITEKLQELEQIVKEAVSENL